MTRWARGGSANKKKANEATPWTEMVAGVTKTQKTKKKSTKKQKPSPTASGQKKDLNKKSKDASSQSHHKQKKKQQFNPADLEKSLTKEKSSFRKRFGYGFGLGGDELQKPPAEAKGLAADLEKLKSSAVHLSTEQEKQLSVAIKKDKRREKRRLKRANERQMSKICFNCRQPGHEVEDCPQVRRAVDQGTGICFKCGSTEHKVDKCRMKVPQGHYPYAKCFICEETGHLSKQCPDNPKGLYPKGGCCKLCSSVEHYMKDCPELQSQQGIKNLTLPTQNWKGSVDDEVSLHQPKTARKKTGPKLVKF